MVVGRWTLGGAQRWGGAQRRGGAVLPTARVQHRGTQTEVRLLFTYVPYCTVLSLSPASSLFPRRLPPFRPSFALLPPFFRPSWSPLLVISSWSYVCLSYVCLRAEKNEAYFFLSSSFFLQSPFSITLFCFSCNNMRALNPDSEKKQFARFPSNSRPLVLLVVNICRLNSMARACAQTGVGRGGEQGDMKS